MYPVNVFQTSINNFIVLVQGNWTIKPKNCFKIPLNNKQYITLIIYQCYVYRTNIRHIPPEVAWECETTSVIRWVWYDANFMG